MAFTTANDWLERFRAAGFAMQIDATSMRPATSMPRTPESVDLWSEIRGSVNTEKWEAVNAEVRRRVGSISSWTDFPIRG